jgi:hypothetical protein
MHKTIKKQNNMKKLTVNIVMLSKMKASFKKLTMDKLEEHLRYYRSQINGRGFERPEQYPALLRMYFSKYVKNDYDLFQADVPLLLTWINNLTQELESKPKNKNIQNMRSALAAFVEFVMHNYGIDITTFHYTDALSLYASYKSGSQDWNYAQAA